MIYSALTPTSLASLQTKMMIGEDLTLGSYEGTHYKAKCQQSALKQRESRTQRAIRPREPTPEPAARMIVAQNSDRSRGAAPHRR
jgi:hypothetical protein